MSCCGNQRAAMRHDIAGGAPVDSRRATPNETEFEYQGQGQLVVTGPMTGRVYRFSGSGARVLVHGLDAPSLVSVPALRALR